MTLRCCASDEAVKARSGSEFPVPNQFEVSQGVIEGAPTLAIVPGAFFKEYPQHDATGERIVSAARELGCPVHQVPLPSFCSPQAGARSIAQWFEERINIEPAEAVIIVSLSKGTADAASFLSSPDYVPLHGRIRGWISISGLFCGSPLINTIARRPLLRSWVSLILRWHGYTFSQLNELLWHADRLPTWNEIPEVPFPILHVQSFPRAAELSSALARRCARRILPHGPSDGGGVLLSDTLRYPGRVWPVLGKDHYFRDVPMIEMVRSMIAQVTYPCEPHVEKGSPSHSSPRT